MTISDKNRRLFEDIGITAIRRELAAGGIQYLGIDDAKRNEAREWVQEAVCDEQSKRAARERLEQQRFNVIRMWTITAALAGIVAAVAAVIADFR